MGADGGGQGAFPGAGRPRAGGHRCRADRHQEVLPVAGELALDWDTLTRSVDPDQELVVRTAEAGTRRTTPCASSPRGPPVGPPSP